MNCVREGNGRSRICVNGTHVSYHGGGDVLWDVEAHKYCWTQRSRTSEEVLCGKTTGASNVFIIARTYCVVIFTETKQT